MSNFFNQKFLFCFLLTVLLFSSFQSAFAAKKRAVATQEVQENVELEDLNVNGVKNDEFVDHELNFLKNELTKNKKRVEGYKEKKGIAKDLSGVVKEMVDEHAEFMIHRQDYLKTVDQFNKQIDCQEEPSTPGCGKFFKKDHSNNSPDVAQESEDQAMIQIKKQNYANTIASMIHAKEGQYRHCYQKELDQEQLIKGGKTQVNLAIEATGKVAHLNFVSDASFKHPSVLNCISQQLSNIHFPPTPTKRGMMVKQPLNFVLNQKEQDDSSDWESEWDDDLT
jgi:hypothetical protein